MTAGTLYFIPVPLTEDTTPQQVVPPEVIQRMHSLRHFIVENEKTARHFLGASGHPVPMREITLTVLTKDTPNKDLQKLLQPVQQGMDVGLMSEAGCPGIADPGAALAAVAHHKGIRVSPLIGPSSLLLALMASGLNGQRFTFLGYLPSDKNERIRTIKGIEFDSKKQQATQLFIETPYRNQHVLEDLIANLQAQTKLCVACNVSGKEELIVTKTVADWKKAPLPDLHKKPTVFLLLA
ncbi:SAM-dependent methyltransferase [Methylophilus sp. VKM B-3414]|jgi:16S rRNA (cytidine1402-2'-O)-methyltransferase|uniref:SAM-dependent methyltransferase n=1 Tax=unclassified Methylophilus TaxID=2630143 RepID=UPI00188F5B02|nr:MULTISPECIES: SAM-dependent methyltransferase [unclassified Methylophilus]MBF5038787.1 SAM-dependent methyltransferase [Methylophilus sp. 13]MDT7850023.1 SAM-dependent methyltransferase [Methylophilus sp. VKM B-3414]